MSWAHYNLAAAHGSVGGLTRIRQQGVSEGPDPRLDYSSIYTSVPRGMSSSLIPPWRFQDRACWSAKSRPAVRLTYSQALVRHKIHVCPNLYQWRIQGGGGVSGVTPPPPPQRLFFFFFACQYMKIPADLDPNPPPPSKNS